MRKFNIILALLMSLHFASFSQKADKAQECLKKIKEYTLQKNSLNLPSGKDYYYLKNKIQISFWEKTEMPDIVENIEMIVGNGQLHYIADDIEMHQDKNDLLLIAHNAKSIIRTYPRSESTNSKEVKEKMQFLDKAFFDMIDKLLIAEYNNQGDNIQLLEMQMNKKAQSVYSVNKVLCHYNTNKNNILKTELFYVEDYQYKKMTIWYYDENYDYKANLKNKVIYYALDKRGKLLSQYQNYEFTNDKDF